MTDSPVGGRVDPAVGRADPAVGRADLHVHTTASDGAFTPDALVAAARSVEVGAVAVTDHDTVAGVDACMEAGRAVQTDMCRQCGRCATHCPSDAIEFSLDNFDFKDELVRRISSYVDVT